MMSESPYRKPAIIPTIAIKKAVMIKNLMNKVIHESNNSIEKEMARATKELPSFYDACMKRITKEAYKGCRDLWYTGAGAGFFTDWSPTLRRLLANRLKEDGFKVYIAGDDYKTISGILIWWAEVYE